MVGNYHLPEWAYLMAPSFGKDGPLRHKLLIVAPTKGIGEDFAWLNRDRFGLSGRDHIVVTSEKDLRGYRLDPRTRVEWVETNRMPSSRFRPIQDAIELALAQMGRPLVAGGSIRGGSMTYMQFDEAQRLSPSQIARAMGVPPELVQAPNKEESTSTMQTSITNVKTKAGHVGQVINSRTGEIVWESSPYNDDITDDKGKVVKTAQSRAYDAAEARQDQALETLFADASA